MLKISLCPEAGYRFFNRSFNLPFFLIVYFIHPAVLVAAGDSRGAEDEPGLHAGHEEELSEARPEAQQLPHDEDSQDGKRIEGDSCICSTCIPFYYTYLSCEVLCIWLS